MATFNQNKQNGQQKGFNITLVGRFAFLVSLSMLLVGCEKQETYPDIPQITYINHTLEKITTDTRDYWQCNIKFELKDGDGDVGLPTPDSTTLSDYRYNLFFTQLNKNKGLFVEVPANPNIPFSYTILPFEPEGNNKQQKATITVKVDYLSYPADTIKLRFYLKDRALNSSNTVETADIVFKPAKNRAK